MKRKYTVQVTTLSVKEVNVGSAIPVKANPEENNAMLTARMPSRANPRKAST